MGDPIIRQDTDILKMEKAINNGFSGIRLFQPDVFEDKYDWETWTINAISLLKTVDKPLWIFPNNSIYERYLKLCKDKNINTLIINTDKSKKSIEV